MILIDLELVLINCFDKNDVIFSVRYLSNQLSGNGEFSVRVKRLEELKVDFAFEVEHLKEDNTYKVTVYGVHDWDKLDEITNDVIDG